MDVRSDRRRDEERFGVWIRRRTWRGEERLPRWCSALSGSPSWAGPAARIPPQPPSYSAPAPSWNKTNTPAISFSCDTFQQSLPTPVKLHATISYKNIKENNKDEIKSHWQNEKQKQVTEQRQVCSRLTVMHRSILTSDFWIDPVLITAGTDIVSF